MHMDPFNMLWPRFDNPADSPKLRNPIEKPPFKSFSDGSHAEHQSVRSEAGRNLSPGFGYESDCASGQGKNGLPQLQGNLLCPAVGTDEPGLRDPQGEKPGVC